MNWHMITSGLIVVVLKIVGTTLFLLYFPQIFGTNNDSFSPTGSYGTVPQIFGRDNISFSPTESSGTVCPRSWDFHQGRCFFLSTFEMSWNKSKDNCEREESTLAIVNTPEKLVRALEGYSEAVHPTSASVGGDGGAAGLVERGRALKFRCISSAILGVLHVPYPRLTPEKAHHTSGLPMTLRSVSPAQPLQRGFSRPDRIANSLLMFQEHHKLNIFKLRPLYLAPLLLHLYSKYWIQEYNSIFNGNVTNHHQYFNCVTIGLTKTFDAALCDTEYRWICEKRAK
ncbi:C-type lectin domain family 5 member A [Rhinolophus sinicus]|uniref:C-type lectin domain family 5 member A n=1 Tax=Rhinolophus sinicus TaxID=89399 RepID=UPI003D79C3AE